MPISARDVMTTELITVTPATPLSEFARICAEDNISGTGKRRGEGLAPQTPIHTNPPAPEGYYRSGDPSVDLVPSVIHPDVL